MQFSASLIYVIRSHSVLRTLLQSSFCDLISSFTPLSLISRSFVSLLLCLSLLLPLLLSSLFPLSFVLFSLLRPIASSSLCWYFFRLSLSSLFSLCVIHVAPRIHFFNSFQTLHGRRRQNSKSILKINQTLTFKCAAIVWSF